MSRLKGKKFGVIGAGEIGLCIAKIANHLDVMYMFILESKKI